MLSINTIHTIESTNGTNNSVMVKGPGSFICRATNSLGSAQVEFVVLAEGKFPGCFYYLCMFTR